jgi:hypothetical protein
MQPYSYEYVTKDENGNEIIFDVHYLLYGESPGILKIMLGDVDVTNCKLLDNKIILAEMDKAGCWDTSDDY